MPTFKSVAQKDASGRIRGIFAFLALAWFCLILFGFKKLQDYKLAPGSPGSPPLSWPAQTRIVPMRGHPTLIFFAHPRCPCTRASVGELTWIMTRLPIKIRPHIVFFKPSNLSDDWVRTDIWRSAGALPGAIVHDDRDGFEARQFNVETSGHVLLYDPDGRLIFSGGITGSRGHLGINAGRKAVLSLLTGRSTEKKETPVFGCSLIKEKPEMGGT